MGVDLRKIKDTYCEKLLVLQFEVTEEIDHKLTKGETRERMLEQLIKDELENINIKSGIITCGEWQSSQADCIVLNKKARSGNVPAYDAEDCCLFMEIKSKSVRREYEQLQNHAKELKQKNPNIIVGMFSYRSAANRSTVLSQFGFAYDKELDTFLPYDCTLDKYPDIDFYYNLNIEKIDYFDGSDKLVEYPYCVIKDSEGVKNLFLQSPVISNFINIFRGTIE